MEREISHRQIWEVVGGLDTGGILVRLGADLGSNKLQDRLSTGALVREVQRKGDRLFYYKLSGSGPQTGWVSVTLKGKPLLITKDESSCEPGVIEGKRLVRIWAISDVHTDYPDNRNWIKSLNVAEYGNDVLILAGDVSNKFQELVETLRHCRASFSRVFFVAGNHDLWLTKEERNDKSIADSVGKLRRILKTCKDEGIEVAPAEVRVGNRRVLIVPLLSWHHPQWDTEPDIDGWDGLRPVEQTVSDYILTVWPEGIEQADGSAARVIDALNDEVFDMQSLVARREGYDAVISFSHFVPRCELNPEKRYLTTPSLAKAIGSTYLRDRVNQLGPDVHIFGHTHFGYDMTLDNVRYLQAPLSYPAERFIRATTVALSDFPEIAPEPCLVWDSENEWAPRYSGAWSDYVMRYGRRPDVTNIIPSYVAGGLSSTSNKSSIGWIPGRMPAWLFGPLQLRERETRTMIDEIRKLQSQSANGSLNKRAATALALYQGVDAVTKAKVIAIERALQLYREGRCNLLDVRSDATEERSGSVPGCIAMPHPGLVESFPTLPDAELVDLCEQILAKSGPLLLLGDPSGDCQEPAVLLTFLLRLSLDNVKIVDGGFEAFQQACYSSLRAGMNS